MAKSSIIFLPVPDSLKDEMRRDAFIVDPSIPLPVELDQTEPSGEGSPEPGTSAGAGSSRETELDSLSDKLSWEMILSGMLRIISDPEGMEIPPEWIDYYRRFVLTVKPEIYHEFSNASIVKAGNGEFDMALEISAVLEGLFPGSPGVLLNKALILEERAAFLEKNGHETGRENAEANSQAALEAYETALSMEPVLPDTLFNAGFFFMRLKEFARARDCFSRYLSVGEESEIPPEKRKQARKIIKDIGEQGLDDDSFREAYDCISRGNDEMGLSRIREFIERRPKVWNGWFVLGWALRKLGRYGDSLESFRKAVELGGAGSDIRNEMAICLMELGDLGGARKELETALREEPENIKIISNLGVLAMKAGKRDEAAAFFRTILELDPDDPLARHFLEEK